MGWQIIKNPKTKNYQVFSSIVDAFILEEATKEELTNFWKQKFGSAGEDNFNRIIKQLDEGGKPYFQFTKDHKSALMWHIHSTSHKHGSCSKTDIFDPKNCDICSDIQKDEERENARTTTATRSNSD